MPYLNTLPSMYFQAFTLSLMAFVGATSLAAHQAPPREPRELLAALNRAQVDPAATYKIDPSSRIELRRGEGKLLLEEGYLAFFAPVEGKITGAVFSGRGHMLAAPRDPIEKQQLAHFLGAPVIDLDFATAYLRFTDDTAAELLHDFQSGKIEAETNSAFADAWQAAVLSRNPAHSLRILSETFSQTPQPYFIATLGGASSGAFDFVYDQARDEPQMFGQSRKSNGADFYDVWSSYRLPGTSTVPAAFRAERYQIETTIHADNSIAAVTTVHIRAEHSAERLLPFEFSSLLAIESATLAGKALVTFPDQDTNSKERASSGNEMLFVLLPEAMHPGDEIEVTFRYHGNVIRNAGNGVLFVDARESWYPHLGDTAAFSKYDLTFHWPRKLRLAATGSKIDEREDGDMRTGHWRTEKPASVAGFNLGEYAFASLAGNGYSIDVYANRQLEQALLNRLRQPDTEMMEGMPRPFGSRQAERLRTPMPEPSPADALKRFARDIDSSIRFYETYSGPFPVHQLSVSQIPGTFGQGWPGLLYISTYSFLPTETQERAGLTASGQEHFHDLVPFHEVAHQWWGNVVGWSSYRDQWIDEAISSYLSLLFADSQKAPDHKLRLWLDRFRKRLVEKDASEIAPAEIGSLELGSRLGSSRNPEGFEQVIYGKGAWFFHMLREMLRETAGKNPDARFIALLHTLQTKYAYRALSTEDLQSEIEAVMTPAMSIEGRRSMEWFFADWVRGTGVPHYRVQYSTKQSEKGFVVKGKLLQSGVANSFVAPVPIYSSNGGYLGRVIAGGPETPFHFVSAREPGKLLIDPQMTLLCIAER
jgi:Peptidase family M1 domain